MKKLIPLVIIGIFLALIAGMVLPQASTAVAQQERVEAQFSTWWIYDSPEDVFINGEVTGKNDWHTNLGIMTRGLDALRRPLVASSRVVNSTVLDELEKPTSYLLKSLPVSYKFSLV